MLAVGKLFKTYSLQKKFVYDFSTSHCCTLNVARQKYPNKLEFTPDDSIHDSTFKKSKNVKTKLLL